MVKTYKINAYLLIGIILSVLIHLTVFGILTTFERKKEEKEEKPIYVYLSETKNKPETVPKVQRKIPKKTEKKPQPKPKPKPKPRPKPRPKPKPKPKPVEKPKPEAQPVEKIQPEPQKTEVIKEEKSEKKEKLPDISFEKEQLEQELDESLLTEDIPDINPKEESTFDLSKLEGKNEVFQSGTEDKIEEKKVSDEDIMAYIKELEMYLNNLARSKDLYPPLAKRLRIEGSLILRFTIKADGSVDPESIKIISSSGYNVLDKGAVKLIEKYVPEFARKYGKKPPKGDLTIELPVTFEIIGW